MAGRSHLSIGEVLSLLQEEFPDVTISKIRFLESQGLVDPERTPSGYRKFYEPDIERLRWVLRQQRDAFLPLKVIKGRLEEQGESPDADGDEGEGGGRALCGGCRGAPHHRVERRCRGCCRAGRPGPASPERGRRGRTGSAAGSERAARLGPPGSGPAPPALTEPLFDAGPPYSAYGPAIEHSGAGRRPLPARAGTRSPVPDSRSARRTAADAQAARGASPEGSGGDDRDQDRPQDRPEGFGGREDRARPGRFAAPSEPRPEALPPERPAPEKPSPEKPAPGKPSLGTSGAREPVTRDAVSAGTRHSGGPGAGTSGAREGGAPPEPGRAGPVEPGRVRPGGPADRPGLPGRAGGSRGRCPDEDERRSKSWSAQPGSTSER